MSRRYFPIALNIKDKRVLVVGAGPVAERKVRALLAAHASITLVAPRATVFLARKARAGILSWRKRNVRSSDTRGMYLVVAATHNSVVNERIGRRAQKTGALVNVVDEPKASDFISPALARFKKAIVAVYTDGKDPVLSRDLKNYLKERWHDFQLYRNKP